ncbi:SDR family NAD(P)-dependent oxidoreductase [Seongchinamella sediminis]|uniref:SDR family NAD(P)-dependent oxidoreductase n=1 Tax=Seongchinamella sediminis TaxID=2283635 RepID=A0A3L7E2N8_9GAMM|nr:SDR family NAD(P)-dependent oxidoreductase [Seongchinamella sediminis]RLQ22643.1 SDR family NAD(P)-dependent oxidoreductase [Seongchinamella sediminis]
MPLTRRQLLVATAALGSAGALSACGGNRHEVTIDRSLPVSDFGAESTGEEVTAGLDLSGKVALVTGCNSGLGFETMRVLALRGAHVLGTGRTLAKAETACASVAGKTTPLALELADFQSAVDCAAAVADLGLIPDIVVLNAGINTFGELELVNGIEKIFTVNFLGHFVLANHLLPPMVQRGQGRIVHVSSRSAYRQAPPAGIDFDNLRGEKAFDAGAAYGRSKLANALFSLELARRLQGTGLSSNAIHPGLVKTNIARTAPLIVRRAFDLLGGIIAKTPAQGAATQLYVATSPALDGVSGAYFEDCNPVTVSGPNHLTDAAMARKLWQTAEAMTAGYLA